MRAPIESYLRATVIVPGGSIEAGLQRRRGEPLHWLRGRLRDVVAERSLVLNGDPLDEDNGQRLTDALDIAMDEEWPDRAWFVELWIADASGSGECLTQVYAPFGMPHVG